MPVIETRHLSKIYQLGKVEVRALQDVDLTINKGELISIMGPSGSGKSTLLNLIGCLDTATVGTYSLDGIEVNREAPLANIRNQKIGFIFQTFNLLHHLTAAQNIEVPMIYAGQPPHRRQERSKKLLTEVGLGERLHHRPNELSGGERQRVAIARALANDPAILLADEPTGNLDSTSGGEIEEILLDLNHRGATVLIVTHDERLGNRTERKIELLDGKVVAQ